jgi:hypothetical protein
MSIEELKDKKELELKKSARQSRKNWVRDLFTPIFILTLMFISALCRAIESLCT